MVKHGSNKISRISFARLMRRDFKIKKSNPKFDHILHKFKHKNLLIKHAKGLQ